MVLAVFPASRTAWYRGIEAGVIRGRTAGTLHARGASRIRKFDVGERRQ